MIGATKRISTGFRPDRPGRRRRFREQAPLAAAVRHQRYAENNPGRSS